MEVSSYISDLLFLHDCVILPEFGGFVANYRAAEIKHPQNSFSPPAKDIAFNKDLVNNDGLLINYISEVEGYDYSDSKKIVSLFVKETLQKLKDNEDVCFDKIGYFYYDKQQNLQFNPDYSTNFLIDSYGLSSFQFPAVEQYKANGKYTDKGSVKNILTVKQALIGVALIVALALIPFRTNFLHNYSTLPPVSNLQVDNISKPEALRDNPGSVSESIDELTDKQNALFYEEPELSSSETRAEKTEAHPPIPKGGENLIKNKFYLIVGSFKVINNANKLNKQLLKDGFSPEVLKEENGYHRVALCSFTTKDTAVKKLKKVQSEKKEFPGIWLLSI